jgi:hypothetical protein
MFPVFILRLTVCLYTAVLCVQGSDFVRSVYQCCPNGVCRSDNDMYTDGYFLLININFDSIVRVGTFSAPKTVDIAHCNAGRDSSVGIATRYGLDGPGIESQWWARFSAPVQTGPGAHPASYTVGTGSLAGGKTAGAWR